MKRSDFNQLALQRAREVLSWAMVIGNVPLSIIPIFASLGILVLPSFTMNTSYFVLNTITTPVCIKTFSFFWLRILTQNSLSV